MTTEDGADRETRGHAVLSHTADVMIEAWGPDPGACYEEAVAAFVEIFADVSPAVAVESRPVQVGPAGPDELLVLLLEEILGQLDGEGLVPVSSRLQHRQELLVGTWQLAPVEAVSGVGPVPKGISYNLLSFRSEGAGWRCRAIVDV